MTESELKAALDEVYHRTDSWTTQDTQRQETFSALTFEQWKARVLALAAQAEAEMKGNYERACQTIAEMHAAAVGEVTGPIRGVVEDVADLRARLVAAPRLSREEAEKMVEAFASALGLHTDEWHGLTQTGAILAARAALLAALTGEGT